MSRKKFPSDQYCYSVSFPPGMRDWIKQEARINHRSMNAEIIYRLDKSREQQKTAAASHAGSRNLRENRSMTMEHTITIDQLQSMPVGEIAALNSVQLARLQAEAIAAVNSAKLTKDLLDGVLNHKYGEQAAEFRRIKAKDFGIVRFNDGDVTITSDLPKKPVWDQRQLATIVERIREAGDDPSEYIETTFKISESKFNAWPDPIRRTFEPARTLKAGKPVFTLTCNGKEGA